MTKHRVPFWILVIILALSVVLPARAEEPPDLPKFPAAQKAGSITALLPIARLTRGTGKAAVTADVKKGDELAWNDLLKTERGGRARVTLLDSSILSLGSQAQLKIVKHDARTQQTALELGYGRLRAEVATVTRTGGGFELRTPTAVAGVIGTDFGSDASSIATTIFLCISGIVQVANSDPKVGGGVQCAPGMTTSVTTGKPPTIPKAATHEQIQELIQQTEPALISAMSPASAMPGAQVTATLSGTHFTGINAASVSGTGVNNLKLVTVAGDVSATVSFTLAPDAAPGPRTITLTKPSGAASAAVFNILAPPKPGGAGTDPKAPYLAQFDQQDSVTRGGMDAYLAGVQQAADQASQALQQANQANVDLTQANNNLAAQVAAVQTAINAAKTQVDSATATAKAAFTTQSAAIMNALLQRNPAGVPDATFNQAMLALFQEINSTLGNTFVSIRSGLTAAIQQATANIAQVQTTTMSTLTAAGGPGQGPTPNVNAIERTIDLGAAFGQGGIAGLDGSSSKALPSTSITHYSWVLCDSSYKPAQFGIPIAANTLGCTPLQGPYSSSTPEFDFPTCNLAGADYIARLTLTDSNGKQTAMDVKVHVLPPTYDDPKTRVQNLAAAYSTLQLNQYLGFFDSTNFPGYTVLAENARNTFAQLGSMNINPIVTPPSPVCNDVTARATWNQNYTFQQKCATNPKNPKETVCVGGAGLVFSQSEQLSIRMTRTPAKGWFVVDYQGDNGTVQGVLPGFVFTDTPTPNLIVTGILLGTTPVSPTTPLPLAPGAVVTVTAQVTNAGTGDLTSPTTITFQVINPATQAVITTVTANVPIPLAASATTTVTAQVTIPTTVPIGTPLQLAVGCQTGQPQCNAATTVTQPVVAVPPVNLAQVGTLSLLSGGPAQTLTVSASGAATLTLVLPTGITTTSSLTQTLTAAGSVSWTLSAGFTAATGTALTNIQVTSFGGLVTLPITYSNAAEAQYTISAFAVPGHTAPYTGAQGFQDGETSLVFQISVTNVGNLTQSGSITVTGNCAPNTSGQCSTPLSTTIAAPAAGATTVATLVPNNFNLPPGTYTGTFTLTTTLSQISTTGNTLVVPFEAVDFQLVDQQPFGVAVQNALIGGTATVTFGLSETGNPTPFNIPITVTPANPNLTYALPNPSMAAATSQTLTITSTPAMAPGAITVTLTGTNHGVTRIFNQTIDYLTEVFVPTNLFLNDASDPLEIQMSQVLGNPLLPTLNMKLQGTVFAGAVTLVPPITTLGFNSTLTPTTVIQNGTFTWQLTANASATGTITPLNLVGQIPNSAPAASVQYVLYVKAVGVPDLQVVSATCLTRTLSPAQPWLPGEPLDWQVVVKNGGIAASTGGEKVQMLLLGGYEVDNGSVTAPVLASGASATLTIHTVAPDIDQPSFTSSSTSLATKIFADSVGDMNYANNTLTQTVPTADWHILPGTVPGTPGVGSSDANPLLVNIFSGGGSAVLTGYVDGGGGFATQTFTAAPGAISSGVSLSNLAAGPSANQFTVSLTFSNSNAQNGLYALQVIVQMKDPATNAITAQRQATVHISGSGSGSPSPFSYAVNGQCVHNGQRCDPLSGTPVTIQINGALTEQYQLTVVTPGCVPSPATGLTCTGTTDVIIHDDFNTSSTPSLLSAVAFGASNVVQVAANQDAAGNILTGPASNYSVSFSGIQRFSARGSAQTSPDAVGPGNAIAVQVGDINVTTNLPSNFCIGVVPGSPTPTTISATWNPKGGFNAPITWELEDVNHAPVGISPITFSATSGSATLSGGAYSPPLPTFSLVNVKAQDGLLTYYLAATITNGISSATKYFPFFIDASLNQNFCGAASSARGFGTVMKGSWSRSGGGLPVAIAAVRSALGAVSDLQLSASDVTFTPSIPRTGDNVQVRFRMSNLGPSDAVNVPIALQVNGVTVASDTFSVAKGASSLGGLTWSSARLPAGANSAAATALPAPQAYLVVDPQRVTRQRTTLGKTVPLARFRLLAPGSGTDAPAYFAGGGQRVLIELEEGACVGLRVASGSAGPCGTADVEITLNDLAKSGFSMNTLGGIADLGLVLAANNNNNVRYSAQAAGVAGHSYAVQLGGGKTGRITIASVRNPGAMNAQARALFRSQAVRMMRKLGPDSGPVEPGDTAGTGGPRATMFLEVLVQAQ